MPGGQGLFWIQAPCCTSPALWPLRSTLRKREASAAQLKDLGVCRYPPTQVSRWQLGDLGRHSLGGEGRGGTEIQASKVFMPS
eukprot:6019048-Pyramimonas_sp.AAC.1